jgi:hypothetical protein
MLKINKWAHLERNSMQSNDIYNIPLPRGPGPKKKKRNVGQITRGVFFLKNQTEVNILFGHRAQTALSPSPSELPTLLLVPSSTASTFVLARSRGGTGN